MSLRRPPASQMKTKCFPLIPLQTMKKKDFFGIPFDIALGGAGQDYIAYALVIEEIAKVCASTAVILSTHTSLCCCPIALFGSEYQKKQFLRGLLSGEMLGAFALTEPEAGSDVGAVATTAIETGNSYLLKGEKIFITNAGHAGVYVVFAKNMQAASYRHL